MIVRASPLKKKENVMATIRSGEFFDPEVRPEPFALHEVDGLRELRQLAGKGQADIAYALNIRQPSVSKIEKQTDMYLSTLRSYVEAIGGKLELSVKLPKRPALRIHQLGDVSLAAAELPARRKSDAPSSRRRHG
jgi:DNA-binding XRE family transcriptional regulator